MQSYPTREHIETLCKLKKWEFEKYFLEPDVHDGQGMTPVALVSGRENQGMVEVQQNYFKARFKRHYKMVWVNLATTQFFVSDISELEPVTLSQNISLESLETIIVDGGTS